MISTTTTLPTDPDLVTQARAGSASAFELIMRRHNRLLYRTARGIVAGEAQAQDVVQETYLRAFTRLDTFRHESTLSTWLARIAINVALDLVRREGRHISLDAETEPSAPSPFPESAMSTHPAQGEAADAAAERGQMRGLLQEAITQLPPLYRSVFMLRAVEEMSVEETAQCLNVSTDVVKTRYLRARALLRDTLGARIEAHSTEIFAFDGAHCDAVVGRVLWALRQQGLIRT